MEILQKVMARLHMGDQQSRAKQAGQAFIIAADHMDLGKQS